MESLSEALRRFVEGAAFEAVALLEGTAIVWCNPAMAELVGLSREELVGRSVLDFAEGEDRERVVEAIQHGRTEPYQGTLVRADGERRIVEVRARTQTVDGKPFRVTTLRDRTAERLTEAALRRSEARYRRLFEVAADGIMVMGLDGRPREVNDRFCAMTGWPRGALLGTDPAEGIADLRENPMRLDRLDDGPYLIERRLRRPDGREIHVEVSVAAFGEGEAVAVFRDVTERKRAAAEQAELRDRLQRAERLEALGRLAGGVAHDFNNLLTVIVGAAESVAAGEVGQAAAITEAAARGAELTSQLLDFSQDGPRRIERFDLGEHLRGLLPLLARLLGATEVRPVITGGPLVARADSSQWTQVVMNLVLNARDASPPGAPIDVRVRRRDDEEGPHLVLEVEDRGPGIAPDLRARIFEPFFTTKPVGAGTGLGLSTVYGVVRGLGGTLSFDTGPEGTCFRAEIPALDVAASVETPAAAAGHRAARVLLIEDNVAVRRSVARILTRAGHVVVEAGDLAEGRAALGSAGPFDVILSDVVMPGASGVGILKDAGDVPVIFMSGFPRAELRGAPESVRFLAKPFAGPELLAVVEEVVDQNGRSSPGKGTSSS